MKLFLRSPHLSTWAPVLAAWSPSSLDPCSRTGPFAQELREGLEAGNHPDPKASGEQLCEQYLGM